MSQKNEYLALYVMVYPTSHHSLCGCTVLWSGKTYLTIEKIKKSINEYINNSIYVTKNRMVHITCLISFLFGRT